MKTILKVWLAIAAVGFLFSSYLIIESQKTECKKQKGVGQLLTVIRNDQSSRSKEANGTKMKNIWAMKKRMEHLREVCHSKELAYQTSSDVILVKNPILKTSLFFSDKYKLLVCEIPKCGSSNLVRFLLTIQGVANQTTLNKMSVYESSLLAEKKLSARSISNIQEIAWRMDTYKKLVLVREPFSRLLSAYRDKIERNYKGEGHYGNIARRIYEQYGGNKTDAEHTNFEEFIRYISDPKNKAQKDPHWNFYQTLCSPCLIHYDFIAHMETINEDMNYITKSLGIEGITFPHGYNSATDWSKVIKYYSSVSPQLVNNLYHLYEWDYELFDFPPPPQF